MEELGDGIVLSGIGLVLAGFIYWKIRHGGRTYCGGKLPDGPDVQVSRVNITKPPAPAVLSATIGVRESAFHTPSRPPLRATIPSPPPGRYEGGGSPPRGGSGVQPRSTMFGPTHRSDWIRRDRVMDRDDDSNMLTAMALANMMSNSSQESHRSEPAESSYRPSTSSWKSTEDETPSRSSYSSCRSTSDDDNRRSSYSSPSSSDDNSSRSYDSGSSSSSSCD